MRQFATLTAAMLFIHAAQAQAPAPQAPPAAVVPAVAPAVAPATPPRPTPPTRAVDGPGAPPFTKVAAGNAPLAEGDFVIGPDYSPAPELAVKEGVPVGQVTQFTLEAKDSKFYPGIARDVFGTPDPKNPKS